MSPKILILRYLSPMNWSKISTPRLAFQICRIQIQNQILQLCLIVSESSVQVFGCGQLVRFTKYDLLPIQSRLKISHLTENIKAVKTSGIGESWPQKSNRIRSMRHHMVTIAILESKNLSKTNASENQKTLRSLDYANLTHVDTFDP